MMRCLNDVEIQHVADGEGSSGLVSHARQCVRCEARLDERRRLMAGLTAASAAVPSEALAGRIRHAVSAQTPARGSTVLRPSRGAARKPLWASGAAALAAAAVVMFVVLPGVDAPASLSAAQIIDRSLQQMSGGSGVERLEYELVLSAEYRQRVGLSEGPFRVVQVVDHANPARFKFSQFDENDVLMAAVSQDPGRNRRTEMQRVDGRNYVVQLTALPGPLPTVPQLLRSQGEAILRMMQLNTNQHLSVVEDASGKHYVIELPESVPSGNGAPLDLNRARVDIDGNDFRVRQFSADGTMLGLPFDISFQLISRSNPAGLTPEEWAIAAGPDDVVIEGQGAGEVNDSMAVVLRELGRLQGR